VTEDISEVCLTLQLGLYLYFFLWYWSLNSGPVLTRLVLYHLRLTPSSFCSGYFWGSVSLFSLAGMDLDAPIYAFYSSSDDRSMPPCPASGWNGVSWTLCPVCPWTVILPISAFWVTRSTGLSHHIQPFIFTFQVSLTIVKILFLCILLSSSHLQQTN
jgi:hypothetical protein